MPKTPRLYLAFLINAVVMTGLIMLQIWVGNVDEYFFIRFLGTGLLIGIFLSFVAIFRADFAALESRVLGYIILALALCIEIALIVMLWDLWFFDIPLLKILVTLAVFLGLAFYVLSLKEDLLRERRQRKDGFLD